MLMAYKRSQNISIFPACMCVFGQLFWIKFIRTCTTCERFDLCWCLWETHTHTHTHTRNERAYTCPFRAIEGERESMYYIRSTHRTPHAQSQMWYCVLTAYHCVSYLLYVVEWCVRVCAEIIVRIDDICSSLPWQAKNILIYRQCSLLRLLDKQLYYNIFIHFIVVRVHIFYNEKSGFENSFCRNEYDIMNVAVYCFTIVCLSFDAMQTKVPLLLFRKCFPHSFERTRKINASHWSQP